MLVLVRASHASRKQVELGKVEQTGPPQPFAWEAFPFLTRYFGGVRSLVPREDNVPEYPSDEEPVAASKNETLTKRQDKNVSISVPFDAYKGAEATAIDGIQECFLDAGGKIRIPQVHVYEGTPRGMPDPVMGGYEMLGLRNDVCFDRYGRFGPYGYGYSIRKGGSGAGMNGEREGAEDMWTQQGSIPEVDFRAIKWAEVQSSCLERNKQRFDVEKDPEKDSFTKLHVGQPVKKAVNLHRRNLTDTKSNEAKQVHEVKHHARIPRSAVIIRTWSHREYTVEDIIHLRSMISELSLQSGGQYTVHFLIQVKDNDIPIWAEQQIYDRVLENSLPAEFRGMGTLWSEKQMGLIYSGLEETNFRDHTVNGVYRAVFMALQYFAHQHSEYEYFWNWEMDARYTGHWYHLFDRINQWSEAQPRKGLWERNGRFYIPEVHGTWEDFKQMVRVQSEIGTNSPANIWSPLQQHSNAEGAIAGTPQQKHDTPIWGPEPGPDVLEDQNITTSIPPSSPEKDKYEWGVGESADLVTFSTLFDPEGTEWFYNHDISGYNTTLGYPPRRVAIGATSRLSSKLLKLMHRETILKKHHMFSEMWPASISLHHGLKAVYVPHPVYIDRRWPLRYLADVMNSGRNGASGGSRTSAFGGREHNFLGQSWFYNTGFSGNLWRRWLGLRVDNDGGEREEVAGEGRMCLPAMLLHPVKGVELVVEGGEKVAEKERNGEGDEDGVGVTVGEGDA